MAAPGRRLRVFVSYSHADEPLRRLLDAQLSTLKRSELIEVWCDREITAGREFDPAIAEELGSADLILLLVSANFLNSDYCSSVELVTAMKRHHEGSARVVPIILRPCDWQSTPIGKLAAAPRDGKPVTEWRSRDRAFIDVVERIRRIVEELTRGGAGQNRLGEELRENVGAMARRPQTPPRESQPISRRLVEWRVRIHDAGGAKATAWKTSVLTANEANISTLVDRNFVTTGQLLFLSASLGDIVGPTDEGGSLSVATSLREPLPVGREVCNVLTISASNTFTASRETFGHIVTYQCQKLRVVVEFPADRPATSAFAFRVVEGGKETLPDDVLSPDKLQLELEVEEPPVGSKYVLEWQW